MDERAKRLKIKSSQKLIKYLATDRVVQRLYIAGLKKISISLHTRGLIHLDSSIFIL